MTDYLDGYGESFCIGADDDGTVYIAGSNAGTRPEVPPNEPSFPLSQHSDPALYRVVAVKDGEVVHSLDFKDSVAAHFVQPAPNGFLLCGARCEWSPEGPEKNAVQYDWDGNVVRRLTLGDGISDLRTTQDGYVWCGYFDEGVLGNRGWSHPGPPCIGASGLVQFNEEGEVSFEFSQDATGADILDVYAMNAIRTGEVWLYYYTAFYLTRIRNQEYSSWDIPVEGASGLAFDGDRVLVIGEYRDPYIARIFELGNQGDVSLAAELRLTDEEGNELRRAGVMGQGKRLYAVSEQSVFVAETW